MKLFPLASAFVVITGVMAAATVNASDPLVTDSDGDGVVDAADLDSDNDGIPDIVEVGAQSVAAPQVADGVADNVFPARQWKVDLYRGHFAVMNAPAPFNQDSLESGTAGTPVLVEEALMALDDNTLIFADDDIPVTDNPFDSLAAESRADIVSGGLDVAAANGAWQMIFSRTINASGILTIGAPGAHFDDYAEVFINGELVDNIIGWFPSLPASEVMTVQLQAGDEVELRLTNRGGPGGYNLNGVFPMLDMDTDDDGILNHVDLDSDNDGIPDLQEGSIHLLTADADGNGTIDANESGDTDNDGLVDLFDAAPSNPSSQASIELMPVDTDNDGIEDRLDLDSDADGLLDAIEHIHDTDNDGILDYQDPDSDNDGISDLQEAVATDVALPTLAGAIIVNDTTVTRNALLNCGPNQVASGSNQFSFGVGWNNGPSSGGPEESVLQIAVNDVTYLSVATPRGGGNNMDNATINGGDALIDRFAGASFINGDASNQGNNYIDHSPFQNWAFSELTLSLPVAIQDVTLLATMGIDDFGVSDGRIIQGCLNDTDGDTIPDHIDFDSDADGVPDAVEGVADSDADGTADYLEIDSDNDNIPDGVEAQITGVDSDNDGIDDRYDFDQVGISDDNNDGLDDGIQFGSRIDTDRDGTPDRLDTDSDADGIVDSIEAGLTPESPVDSDADGIPDFRDFDADGDGIDDSIEAGADPSTQQDTDADGVPDFLDLDSDNDLTPDAVEAGSDPTTPGDLNNNGVADFVEPDFAPLDSDADGIPDHIEGTLDSDADGVPDHLDIDADNDGLPDSVEVGGDVLAPLDTDGDGVADYLDLDSDNDGLTDAREAGADDVDGNGIVDNFIDSDSDGMDDSVALAPLDDPDFDADGVVDHLDLDSDNDGLSDVLESIGMDADQDGDGRLDNLIDGNSDGLADGIAVNAILDTDTDGSPNHLDLDSDDDGLVDLVEAGGIDSNDDGRVDSWSDSDNDGLPDNVDVDATGGSDVDNDGIDDVADADFARTLDSDGDGIVDLFDNDSAISGFQPFSSDGLNGAAELPDADGDGVADLLQRNSADIIRTGLSGGGCSLGQGRVTFDPTLLLLLAAGGLGAALRRRKKTSRQRG